MADLTPAEQAAAEALSRLHNRRDDIPMESVPADHADEARAVVAALAKLPAPEHAFDASAKALAEIGAIDDSKPADAGPWVNAPLRIVLDEIRPHQLAAFYDAAADSIERHGQMSTAGFRALARLASLGHTR